MQQLIAKGEVLVNGVAAKASLRLKGNGEEQITVTGPPHAPPLRAIAEEIALDIVYEDDDLAIVNKPAGMMVHAGAGATDDARNRGTLVNALLHHFRTLSAVGGELRPGIVHRLDRATSGLMVVAKNDESHRRLAKQFSGREVHKTYIALVHGWPKQDRGTIQSAISRHSQRRTRMTTRGFGGREAVTHYVVQAKNRFALRQVCAGRSQDRDGTHAPDSRAHVVARTSGGGRRALWRAGRIAVAIEQTAGGRHARDADAGSKFSAFGGARVDASADEGVAEVLPAVTEGTGELARRAWRMLGKKVPGWNLRPARASV